MCMLGPIKSMFEGDTSILAQTNNFFWTRSSILIDGVVTEELEVRVCRTASYVQPDSNLGQCESIVEG